jgi:hypothetical protein
MKKTSLTAVVLGAFALVLTAAFLFTGDASAQSVFPDTGGGSSSSSGTTTIPFVGGTSLATGSTTTSGTTTTTTASSGYCSGVQGQILASGSDVADVLKFFTCFIQNSIIPLLFMLALAVFIWGMVKFIAAGQSAEKEEGQQFMLWGIIALAVMFSVWGLVKIFQDTFQVKNAIPQLTVPK